jgi:hypothetical protein
VILLFLLPSSFSSSLQQSTSLWKFLYSSSPTFSISNHSVVMDDGLQVFQVTDGIIGELFDIFEFYRLLAKDEDPKFVVDFLQENAGWNFTQRAQQNIVLNKTDVMSGDYLAMFNLDGNSLLITVSVTLHHSCSYSLALVLLTLFSFSISTALVLTLTTLGLHYGLMESFMLLNLQQDMVFVVLFGMIGY